MAIAMMNGMKSSLTLDAAGRVVLPLKLRRQFRLSQGSILDIALTTHEIVLRPRTRTAVLVEQGGLLVHEGEPAGDLLSAVEVARQSRDADLARPSG